MPIPIAGFSLANVCFEVERKDRPPLLLQLLFFLPADFCRCDAVLLHLTDKLVCIQNGCLQDSAVVTKVSPFSFSFPHRISLPEGARELKTDLFIQMEPSYSYPIPYKVAQLLAMILRISHLWDTGKITGNHFFRPRPRRVGMWEV